MYQLVRFKNNILRFKHAVITRLFYDIGKLILMDQ